MVKACINVTIYDFHTLTKDAFVIFDKHILSVGPMENFKNDNYEVLDGKGLLLLPGLIVGHTHIYSTFARGLMVPFHPKNFQEILDQLWWKLDRSLDLDMIYHSGIVSAVDHLKNGVTTLIDHHASGVDILESLETLKKAVCNDVGLRGAFAFETSDRFLVDQAIFENQLFIQNNHTPFSKGLFGLHASMSLSEETLQKVSRSLHGAPIHIHVAESEMDQEDCLKNYQERIVHRLYRHGLLTKNSILTHALYVDESELDLIKQQECVVAINIGSNMNNGVGLPNIRLMREKGIRIIIGNDGLSPSITNEYLNTVYAMHLTEKTPTTFGLDDLLAIIQDTYTYINDLFKIQLGKMERGYEADFSLVPYQPPTTMDETNSFGHLFFGLFHSYKPQHVFVQGKQCVKDYRVSEKLDHLVQQAATSANRLWDKLAKEDS